MSIHYHPIGFSDRCVPFGPCMDWDPAKLVSPLCLFGLRRAPQWDKPVLQSKAAGSTIIAVLAKRDVSGRCEADVSNSAVLF